METIQKTKIMSGGAFEYLQRRYEWQEAIEHIEHIIQENEGGLRLDVIEELKKGLKKIKEAQVYLERIDFLLSCDDSQDSFLERLKSDLNKLT